MKLRKNGVALPETKSCKPSTEMRVYDLADRIVMSGWSRSDCFKYMQEEWGIKRTQCQRYWIGALNYMTPEDPEKYRTLLLNRNFELLDTIIRKALESNNLKAANEAIKIMSQMLGVGNKKVEINGKDSGGNPQTFVISFTD